MQKNKNKTDIKVTTQEHIYGNKKRNKSKNVQWNKKCKTIRCAKNSILGLNMNKRDVQEGCANGLYRVCTQSSNTGDENMDVFPNMEIFGKKG